MFNIAQRSLNMSEQLQNSIRMIQKLSPSEQIELMKATLQNVYNITKPAEKLNLFDTVFQLIREIFDSHETKPKKPSFLQSNTLDESIEEQHVKPVTNLDDVKTSFWPEEEPIDDFLVFMNRQRRMILPYEKDFV